MSTDFSKHQSLITKFRGLVNKAGFDAKFSAATNKLAKTESFLLKMELKRLASPCTRSIDLRGLVDGDCQIFDYQGQKHFLDEVAISVFNDNVEVYGGYTFGVYEAVKNTENNFRNIYKNEQANISRITPKASSTVEKKQYSAKAYLFDNYPDRREERMNFAVAITLVLGKQSEASATSVDISVSGIKLRLTNETPLSVGQEIQLVFTGLEQEFHFGKDSVFIYQVQNKLLDGSTQLIGCQRIDVPERDGFEQFLKGFIQGNKRRYKINLDNSIQSLQARSFEQFALMKLNELPVFIQQGADGHVIPKYVLTTTNSQPSYQYWKHEDNSSALNYLITKERFLHLQAQRGSLLVYSFIHQHQGKSFFYSMDELQGKNDMAFFTQFIGFAASKDSFAVTELSLLDLDINKAHSPFTLSSAVTKQQQYINSPPSDEVFKNLSQLSHIIVVKSLQDKESLHDYQQFSYSGIDRQKLKLFGHKRLKDKLPVDEIGINYKNQRQEPRFKYKTPAIIACQSITWSGVSEDFSVSGLKLNLDEPAVLAAGDVVHLSFPNLQKITSAFDLKGLPYKVVRINKAKTTINLRVSVKEHQHIGRSFFKLLIEKNRDKLTPDEYAMLTPGLAEALRTLYATQLAVPALAVQTSGSRYKVETLLVSEAAKQITSEGLYGHMQRLSDRKGFYNLYPILSNLQASSSIDNHLKKLLATDESVTELLYIAINPNIEQIERAVTTKLASELNTPELTRFFIKKSLKQGELYCIKLKLSRADSPQMEYLNPELSYIGSYAIHRGKQIEQEIWSVAGIVQLFDVTTETLFRYKVLSEQEMSLTQH
ncbi:PilZ domain-containing protein [Litorilituus sediminis]|uniref:PilZ domain-containing protein n=1 Tax=Litorilituus sediminis TaxID=718192 RepID=A0A4V0ZFY8_9GAMM|nr:PilZ domain-containing protein [Litorilituus sediminis]QBG35450.1 PilZ domain-containing protein [Litorilituus sediminis]